MASPITIGSPGESLTFFWTSLSTDIIVFNNLFNLSDSSSFVLADHNATITVHDFGFQPVNISGPLAYETFTFSNTPLYGQGFLLSDESTFFSNPSLGFDLGQGNSSDLGLPTLIVSLWRQGCIRHRLISFTYNLNLPLTAGNATIGALPEGVSPSVLTNYTVDIDNGNWAFSLTGMQWGELSLGFNGYLTIDTLCPFGVVPMPVFTTLVSLIGQSPVSYDTQGNVVYAIYLLSQFPDFSVLPNITLYLHHQPLVLTSSQYLLKQSPFVLMSIGGSNQFYIDHAAFTLGTLNFNDAISVFDFEQKTFGRGPLSAL